MDRQAIEKALTTQGYMLCEQCGVTGWPDGENVYLVVTPGGKMVRMGEKEIEEIIKSADIVLRTKCGQEMRFRDYGTGEKWEGMDIGPAGMCDDWEDMEGGKGNED